MKDFTEVLIRKDDYEFTMRINSRKIYDSDLEQIKMFVHHVHGVYDYDQKPDDRPKRNEPQQSQ